GIAALALVEIRRAFRDQRSERTRLLAPARIGRPVQAVELAGCARELLGVGQDAVAVAIDRRVFLLRGDVRAQDADGVELVFADAPVEDLFGALLGREAPDVPP